jgi:hypothetical protein
MVPFNCCCIWRYCCNRHAWWRLSHTRVSSRVVASCCVVGCRHARPMLRVCSHAPAACCLWVHPKRHSHRARHHLSRDWHGARHAGASSSSSSWALRNHHSAASSSSSSAW